MAGPGTGRDVELTSFVGRADDLAEGRRLLGNARLVTLVGPGGVGKTRLARRLADDLGRAFPDGTFLVELAGLRDPNALPAELATALDVDDVTRPPEAAVAAFVRERRLLLVLDNCEHLVEACAPLVHALLQESSGLRVVATSRQPLAVVGEQLMSVDPLSLPEAMQLFCERARLVVPSFEPDAANAALVGRVCTVLDGIPLAIELAAARLRMLSLAQLAERLSDRFGLLAGAATPTGAHPRHQALRASVDWSFDSCSSAEQTLWAWMSVFEGSADLDAVEALCPSADGADGADGAFEASISVFDTVAGLVDKSVLAPQEVAGRVRYRMLDTLRAYGRERLVERGEDERLAERHRAYYVALARAAGQSWFGPDQRDLLARTSADHANLRAAFDRCLAAHETHQDALVIATSIWWYWVGHGAVDEGIRWLGRALALRREATPLTLKALNRATFLAAVRNDLPALRAHAEAALALHVADESEEVRSDRRLVQTLLAVVAGDLEAAMADDAEAVRDDAQLDRLGAEEAVNVHLRRIVRLAWTGSPAEALEHADRAARLCWQHGDEWHLAFVHYLQGVCHAELGRLDEALDAEREALRLARGGFGTYTVMRAVETSARVLTSLGDAPGAAVLLGALSEIWPDVSDATQDRVELVRRQLGETRFAAAFERGRRMTADEVVAFALDEQTGTPPGAASPDGAAPVLTDRELEVAELVARGLSNREIAEALVISPRTAEGHVARLLDKLGFATRARVAAWVAERRAGAP